MKRLLILLLFYGMMLSLSQPSAAQTASDAPPHLQLPFPPGVEYRLTCGYGCYQHQGSMTYAVDLAVPDGTPIVAAADGIVSAITWETGLPLSKNLGDALILYIEHGNGWFTRYVHLSGVTVRVGDTVRQGEIVAYAGHTGTEAAHLHFELKRGENLHAPSYPVDEIFGESTPIIGQAYQVPIPPTPTPSPRRFEPHLPETALLLPTPLMLEKHEIEAGSTITVSMTLHNQTEQTLPLPLVGIVARREQTNAPDDLDFMADVQLRAGERRTFTFTLSPEAGVYTIAPFAFTATYTLYPIGIPTGELPTRQLTVRPARLFLPLIQR